MGTTHAKRDREQRRQERSAAKRERREASAESDDSRDVVDADALMERFRVLSERYEAGVVAREQYEAQRLEIFNDLGLEPTR